MIVLLGGSGYIGSAFQAELRRRNLRFISLGRSACSFAPLRQILADCKADFLINVAGYTGKPNVDACEVDQGGCIRGNVSLPLEIACACEVAGVHWGHVSSGCIYSGAWVLEGSTWGVKRDLMDPAVKALWKGRKQILRGFLRGFSEEDLPNFCFRNGPCSFYSGTKALAEEELKHFDNHYVWRLRIPFDHVDCSRNYLSKLQRYPAVYENVNSISHREDFVKACLDIWTKGSPYGTYNVTNPGFVTSSQVVDMLRNSICVGRDFKYWPPDEFYVQAAVAPRSNCILDTSKLEKEGIRIRSVEEALEDAIFRWTPEGK